MSLSKFYFTPYYDDNPLTMRRDVIIISIGHTDSVGCEVIRWIQHNQNLT